VISTSAKKRIIEVISSTILFHDLRMKVANIINIFPDRLHLQYRLSTDAKATLPCDLQTHSDMSAMVAYMRSRVVPKLTASGRPSARPIKQVNLQLFNQDDGPFSTPSLSEGKVSHSAT
jgi:hypothetical protein